MSRDDIQKLLGGYATGTLTPEEQQALFEAALIDQELFDALAREEALRDVLSDPAARAHLLAAIDDAPMPWYRQWWRPLVVVAAALLMVAGVAVWENSQAPKPERIAKVELPRFRPPAETHDAPILPSPPEVKHAAPAMKPLSLPGAAPVAAPPPAPPLVQQRDANVAQADDFAINGSLSGGIQPPMQQSQQAQQASQQAPQSQQPPRPQAALPAAPPATPAPTNRMFGPASVPLRVEVTDATGAAIPAANVAVKSLPTGDTVSTSTDARGEYTASAAPGSTIQISASAPGYRSTTVNQTVPATGTPEPVNVRLDVAAATETVEVTGNATVLEARTVGRSAPAGLAGAVGGAKKAKAAAPPPALEYHLMRHIPGGGSVEVPAGGTVAAGVSLSLRITPAADGYVRIVPGTGIAIVSPRVRRGVPFETMLPQFDKPGRVELRVFFSKQATESKEQTPSLTIVFNIQ